jgi:hypothetical protein
MASQPTPTTATVTVLKPCPFCGGEAALTSYNSCGCCGKAWNGRVVCWCGAGVTHFDTDAEAIVAWNTRFDTEHNATLERENAALREALTRIRDHPQPGPFHVFNVESGMRMIARNALGGQP